MSFLVLESKNLEKYKHVWKRKIKQMFKHSSASFFVVWGSVVLNSLWNWALCNCRRIFTESLLIAPALWALHFLSYVVLCLGSCHRLKKRSLSCSQNFNFAILAMFFQGELDIWNTVFKRGIDSRKMSLTCKNKSCSFPCDQVPYLFLLVHARNLAWLDLCFLP